MKDCCEYWGRTSRSPYGLTFFTNDKIVGPYGKVPVDMIKYCPECGSKLEPEPKFKPGDLVMMSNCDIVCYNRHDSLYIGRVGEVAGDSCNVYPLDGFPIPTTRFTSNLKLAPPKPEIDGWEAVDFRPPKGGDDYAYKGTIISVWGNYSDLSPEWIMKKKERKIEKCKEYIPTEKIKKCNFDNISGHSICPAVRRVKNTLNNLIDHINGGK